MVYENRKLNLQDMKNMSIDEIAGLYSIGYRLEELQTCESIGCVSPASYNQVVDKYNELAQIQAQSVVLLPVIAIIGMAVSFYLGRKSLEWGKSKE